MRSLFVSVALLASLCSGAFSQTVCIDPGHPSEVGVGTKGRKATEVEVAWQVALLLKERLAQRGIKTVFTKSSLNEKVLNKQRAEVANKHKANLMVRLHCDAAAGSGFAVYYPSKQGTSQGVTGPSQQVIQRSSVAARRFHKAMAESLGDKLKNNGLKTDLHTNVGAKQGALTGSVFSQVPVLLVEMVVLTNRSDEVFILSRSGREALVEALAQGVFAALKK